MKQNSRARTATDEWPLEEWIAVADKLGKGETHEVRLPGKESLPKLKARQHDILKSLESLKLYGHGHWESAAVDDDRPAKALEIYALLRHRIRFDVSKDLQALELYSAGDTEALKEGQLKHLIRTNPNLEQLAEENNVDPVALAYAAEVANIGPGLLMAVYYFALASAKDKLRF